MIIEYFANCSELEDRVGIVINDSRREYREGRTWTRG